jgi:hypothetical protein
MTGAISTDLVPNALALNVAVLNVRGLSAAANGATTMGIADIESTVAGIVSTMVGGSRRPLSLLEPS